MQTRSASILSAAETMGCECFVLFGTNGDLREICSDRGKDCSARSGFDGSGQMPVEVHLVPPI